MLTMDRIHDIRFRFYVKGEKIAQIAQELNRHIKPSFEMMVNDLPMDLMILLVIEYRGIT